VRIFLIFLLSLIVSCSTVNTQTNYGPEIEDSISSMRAYTINKKCGISSRSCVIGELSFSIKGTIVVKLRGEKVIVIGNSNLLQYTNSSNRVLYWKNYSITEESQKNNKVISDFFFEVGRYLNNLSS